MNSRLALLLTLVASAALMRLVPHPPNFTPVAALALFAGAHFLRTGWAFAIPLAAMVASDLVLQAMNGTGFHSTLPAVYLSFVAVVGIGLALRQQRTALRVAGGALAASVLFFLATNFAVWAEGLLYPRTLEGLAACYIAAIPFFGWTVAGDLFYAGVLFGLFAAADARLTRPALQA